MWNASMMGGKTTLFSLYLNRHMHWLSPSWKAFPMPICYFIFSPMTQPTSHTSHSVLSPLWTHKLLSPSQGSYSMTMLPGLSEAHSFSSVQHLEGSLLTFLRNVIHPQPLSITSSCSSYCFIWVWFGWFWHCCVNFFVSIRDSCLLTQHFLLALGIKLNTW